MVNKASSEINIVFGISIKNYPGLKKWDANHLKIKKLKLPIFGPKYLG
jgi:hypothetical protein